MNLTKSAFVSKKFFLAKPLWPLPDLPILSVMSLPECEGPTNSTLCLLPELLEELGDWLEQRGIAWNVMIEDVGVLMEAEKVVLRSLHF